MKGSIRDVLGALKFDPSVDECSEKSMTQGHPKLRKRWHNWDEVNDGLIEWLLGPVLNDVVDWPSPGRPLESCPNPTWFSELRSERMLDRYFDTFLVNHINRAIEHICQKLDIEPVFMQGEPGKEVPGLKIKPDWWGGHENEWGTVLLPGDSKATSTHHLADTFTDYKYRPGASIIHLKNTAWLHTRSWLGQVVNYAKKLGVRYLFLLTAHEVVLGRITVSEPEASISRQTAPDTSTDAANTHHEQPAVPDDPATPTPGPRRAGSQAPTNSFKLPEIPGGRRNLFRACTARNVPSSQDDEGLSDFLSQVTITADDGDSIFHPSPDGSGGMADEPVVELLRIPYNANQRPKIKHFALALVFIHVLASIDPSKQYERQPLRQDPIICQARAKLRQNDS